MLHTPSEAARLAGVCRQTIYRQMERGRLSYSLGPNDTRMIETSELLRLYPDIKLPATPTCNTSESEMRQVATGGELAEIMAELQELRREVKELKRLLPAPSKQNQKPQPTSKTKKTEGSLSFSDLLERIN